MIKILSDKTDFDSLTDSELQGLARGEEISFELEHLAKIAEGIGCMVSHDGDQATASGNFQHADSVSSLLFGLSNSIAVHSECVSIATRAAWKLGQRMK